MSLAPVCASLPRRLAAPVYLIPRLTRIQDTYAHCNHVYRLVYITLCFRHQWFILDLAMQEDEIVRSTFDATLIWLLPTRSSTIPVSSAPIVVIFHRCTVQIVGANSALTTSMTVAQIAEKRVGNSTFSLIFSIALPCFRRFASVI